MIPMARKGVIGRLLVGIGLVLMTPLTLPATALSAAPVVEQPQVQSRARVITRNGDRKLLVEALTVFHAHDVNVLATCPHCLRRPGPKAQEREPARGITRFVRLNWVLDYGLHVRVYVTAPGAIGRYVVLGPAKPLSRHRLVSERSGCLTEGHPADCGEAAPPSSPSSPTSPPSTPHAEVAGGDTETWTDYKNAGGLGGPLIHSGQSVEVSCSVQGYPVADGDTWWYRIASSPWNDAYYASADAFYNNGQSSGSLVNTPYVDEAVPHCET
jgi:hypothetical protein